MEYPQFLHALLLLGEKRRAGFQAVVERILACVFARPTASRADYLMMRNSGDWKDDEFFERWELGAMVVHCMVVLFLRGCC